MAQLVFFRVILHSVAVLPHIDIRYVCLVIQCTLEIPVRNDENLLREASMYFMCSCVADDGMFETKR